jgi:hypothetical protein
MRSLRIRRKVERAVDMAKLSVIHDDLLRSCSLAMNALPLGAPRLSFSHESALRTLTSACRVRCGAFELVNKSGKSQIRK